MKVIFFGTPDFAQHVLAYLLEKKIQIVAVVTQPDKPKGRSLKYSYSAVKSFLLEQNFSIPILQPVKASDPNFLEKIKEFNADLYVVVAFGQILPQSLLDLPKIGCINVHASLLPKYRGAAPIQRAILNGEKETGVCIQKMVKQLDAGDIIAKASTFIAPDMTYGELQEILCELSKPLLLLVIENYEKQKIHLEPQNHELATYASKIEVTEAEIDWNESASIIDRKIRAFSPIPGAWCWIQLGEEKKRLKIYRAHIVFQKQEPKTIRDSKFIGCKENSLELIEIQLEGKRKMKMEEWVRGLSKKLYFL